jgi:hypothetical protein
VATYSEFRRQRFDDPAFRRAYEGWCPVCRTTVEVIGLMHREGCSAERAASRAGVSKADVEGLQDAERCDPRALRKLCLAFGIEPPISSPFESRPQPSRVDGAADRVFSKTMYH